MYIFDLIQEEVNKAKRTIKDDLSQQTIKREQIDDIKDDITINFMLKQWTQFKKILNQISSNTTLIRNFISPKVNEEKIISKEKVAKRKQKDGFE